MYREACAGDRDFRPIQKKHLARCPRPEECAARSAAANHSIRAGHLCVRSATSASTTSSVARKSARPSSRSRHGLTPSCSEPGLRGRWAESCLDRGHTRRDGCPAARGDRHARRRLVLPAHAAGGGHAHCTTGRRVARRAGRGLRRSVHTRNRCDRRLPDPHDRGHVQPGHNTKPKGCLNRTELLAELAAENKSNRSGPDGRPARST